MESQLLEFKNLLLSNPNELAELKSSKTADAFMSSLIKKATLWGFALNINDIMKVIEAPSNSSSFTLSSESIDANPIYNEHFACTDNSNFTAQRPSCCLTCTSTTYPCRN
jgi:hypothetical protein